MHFSPARQSRLPPTWGRVRLCQQLCSIGADFCTPEQTAGGLVESKNQAACIDHERGVLRGVQGGLETEDLGRIFDGQEGETPTLVRNMQHADLRDTKLVADANDGCRRSAVRADNQLLNDVRVGKLQRLEERPPLEGRCPREPAGDRVLAVTLDSPPYG